MSSSSPSATQLDPTDALADQLAQTGIVGQNDTGGSRTGIVYDERCLLHENDVPHLERPERIRRAFALLESSGILARCVRVPARLATTKELIQAGGTEALQKLSAQKNRARASTSTETRFSTATRSKRPACRSAAWSTWFLWSWPAALQMALPLCARPVTTPTIARRAVFASLTASHWPLTTCATSTLIARWPSSTGVC
jgi:hypothetical protein